MIPNNIFQSYKVKREDLFAINDKYHMKDISDKWEKLNPEYNYFYFDDTALEEYVLKHDKDLYECIKECDRINNGAMKADIFRYLVVYKEGGFWADIDLDPNMPINEWRDMSKDFIVAEEFGQGNGDTLNQCFFGSKAGHPIFETLLADIKSIFKKGIDYSNELYVHDTTANRIWAKHIFNYKNTIDPDFNIYPKEYLDSSDPHSGSMFHIVASMNANNTNYKSWRDTEHGRYTL